jgi:hypothetical protein
VAYEHKEFNNVLIEPLKQLQPEYYIIVEKNHDQYKLIGYKERQIFKLTELPFDLKRPKDIVSKKSKEYESFCDSTLQNLYDDTVAVLEISSFASTKVLPGKARRETIKEDNIVDFYKLHSFECWRQKLHDNWIATFEIDDTTWNSITHYVIAQKFGPDNKYYLFFTAESNTPLSKDVQLAIAAGSATGKLKGKVIRPADIKIVKPKISKKRYRKALKAKFEQHDELKQILLSTQNAKLVYFKKGRKPIIADDLMVIRSALQEEK